MTQVIYLDSSALLKRYVAESGSRFIRTLYNQPATFFYISQIANVEAISAFTRLALGKKISHRKAQASIAQFRIDLTTFYRIVPVSTSLIEHAMQLAEIHALRAYDAIQLATALSVAHVVNDSSFNFICADEDLNITAQAAGLLVQNPNNYP